MKISYLWAVMMGLALSGCSSINSVPTVDTVQDSSVAPAKKHNKNPLEVSFYTNGANPNAPYSILGNTSVSQFNVAGIKRQEALIHDAMRSAAASMGGDAIINIKHHDATVSGTVIAYQSKISV